MSPTYRSRLLLLSLCLLLASCSNSETITGVAFDRQANIQYFDTYRGDGHVHIHWTTDRGDAGFGPYPPVLSVVLEVSTTGPETGYEPLLEHFRSGRDSALVDGLANGRNYYFRITTIGKWGRPLGTSKPLMTTPGKQPPVLHSVEVIPAEHPLYTSMIAWSPDEAHLAVIRRPNRMAADLFTLDLSDLTWSQVTHDTNQDNRVMAVAWSPDGQRLTYDHSPYRTNYLTDYRVWVVNLSDSSSQAISPGRVDSDPIWLSDSLICFTRGTVGPPNVPELHLLDLASGGAITPITSDGREYKYHLNVNPATGEVAYAAWPVDSSYMRLNAITLSSGLRRALTSHAYWRDSHPYWTADGQQIYFTSDRSGHTEVWKLEVSTGIALQVTGVPQRYTSHFYGIPSPSGTRIAIVRLVLYEAGVAHSIDICPAP